MKHGVKEVVCQINDIFGRNKNYNELRLLLVSAGADEDDLALFFAYPEGENIPIGLSEIGMTRLLLQNEPLLLQIAGALYAISDGDGREGLECSFRKDGFELGADGDFRRIEIAFELAYCSDIDRVIRVNDHPIATLRLDSENDNVFEFLMKHPNTRHTLNAGEIARGIKVKKTLDDVVKNLGFKGDARKLFFPTATATDIELRNPITSGELKERGYSKDLTVEDLFPQILEKDKKGQKGT